MSRNWTTSVFFERQTKCTAEWLRSTADILLGDGLVSDNPYGGPTLGGYMQDDDYCSFEATDLAEAIATIVDHQKGLVVLWDPTDRSSVDLIMYPCGSTYPSVDADDAYVQYGWVSISVDTTYFTGATESIAKERYTRVFRWSQKLAVATHAIYGCGDLDSEAEMGARVRASDLADFRIPRVSWWGYYGRQFIDRRGRANLYSPGMSWVAWDAPGPDNGFVVILHPPARAEAANREEGRAVGVRY